VTYSGYTILREGRSEEMVFEHRNFRNGAILTSREAAFYLNVHINTVRRWHDRGLIPAYRIGPRGDRRFRQEELERFLVEQPVLVEHELIAPGRK
jgi:excisionase family DNA binding protein